MIRSLSKPASVVGLDIGRSTIKAAQASMGPKGPRLDGALCMKRQSVGGALEPGEGAYLVRAMQRRGIDAKRIVLVAGTEALISASITVPSPGSEIARDPIIKMELSRAHRLIPDTFECAWWDLPANASGASNNQAHVVALPHASVKPTLDTLTGLGFELAQTVPVSVALLSAAQRRPIDPRRLVAVLDLGVKSGHLVLMYAGRVVHERTLPEFNLQALSHRMSESLGTRSAVSHVALGHFGIRDEPEGAVACESTAVLSDATADLAEELGMSFAFISHLYPEAELGPLLLAGGGANVPGLVHALSRELELETAVITPGLLVQGETFGNEPNDPAVTAALGAALIVLHRTGAEG